MLRSEMATDANLVASWAEEAVEPAAHAGDLSHQGDFAPTASQTLVAGRDFVFVRAKGLEPLWLTPHGPKPCACTNSATPAGPMNIPT